MMLQAVQVALNTSEITGSLKLYSEAFGFHNAGGQHIWGDIMRLQGLEPRDRAAMWWMVGGLPFVQLEFFHHESPVQRPIRPDLRPNDLGWVRIGIAVKDFDTCMTALDAHGIQPACPPNMRADSRRIAFKDPYFGAFVEVIEDREYAQANGDCALPALLYATSSVSDIKTARRHYEETLKLRISALETLHLPEDEALWGLAGARREGFVVETGSMLLEIVQYVEPVGRPRRPDWSISDQGIANIALGTRDPAVVEEALTRLTTAGHHPPLVVRFGDMVAAYINDPEREIEYCALPETMDAITGFTRLAPFFGAGPDE